jgi:hypothetical protein
MYVKDDSIRQHMSYHTYCHTSHVTLVYFFLSFRVF